MMYPWQSLILQKWSIVGMNHYKINGERRLFVSMAFDGRCIKAEGPDDAFLWMDLQTQAIASDAKALETINKIRDAEIKCG